MADLLPCPFCGAPAERVDNGPTKEQIQTALSWGEDFDDGGSFIHCTRCDASSPIHFDRKENLYSSWNQRVRGVASAHHVHATRAREEIVRLMREDFDPHPSWELPAGEWDDNADDVADKIIAAVLSLSPLHISDAWRVLKKWLAGYAEEEASFSRYRDDVMLDGIMTAGERRKLSTALSFACCKGLAPKEECGCATVNSHQGLVEALRKIRSYNVDIAAGRINYRPEDHIEVIDRALSKLESPHG